MPGGRLILMGSGELAPSMIATHRLGLEAVATDQVTVLDAPYGFQENADQLTDRIREFFEVSLSASTEVASLRRPDASALEQERMLAAVRRARYVFSGPGSPSYALKVWKPLDMRAALVSVLGRGGTVVFASAAALTVGRSTIPVYEIYKVGEDPHWLEGLDVTGAVGYPVTVVPHWNNAEGGTHDTSRCFIGERRLSSIQGRLDTGILGVDEHTAAILDLGEGTLRVEGVGGVTLRGPDGDLVIQPGETIGLDDAWMHLGTPPGEQASVPPASPTDLREALDSRDADRAISAMLEIEQEAAEHPDLRPELRSAIVEIGSAARSGLVHPRRRVEAFVDLLLEVRQRLRDEGLFEDADLIRERLADLGVEVHDTGEGTDWELGQH